MTRIRFGLRPFVTPSVSADLPYAGTVVNNTIVPDDWSALPHSTGGDGITPVNQSSVLSFQPDGTFQARAAGAAGTWETVCFGGGFFAIEPGGALSGPYPYVAVL